MTPRPEELNQVMIVSHVVGLTLVLLELEKSGTPLPYVFYPLHRRSVSSSIRATRLGSFHDKRRGCKR